MVPESARQEDGFTQAAGGLQLVSSGSVLLLASRLDTGVNSRWPWRSGWCFCMYPDAQQPLVRPGRRTAMRSVLLSRTGSGPLAQASPPKELPLGYRNSEGGGARSSGRSSKGPEVSCPLLCRSLYSYSEGRRVCTAAAAVRGADCAGGAVRRACRWWPSGCRR